MLNEVYTVSFILSFAMLVYLVSTFSGRVSVNYVMLFSCVAVTNLGYMQMAYAQNVLMAVFANQVVYLGASFLPFFLVMCIADLCRVPVRKSVQMAAVFYGCLIFVLTSTIGVQPWYYSGVDFARTRGIGYLVREYGTLHMLYPIYLLVALTAGMIMIIGALRRKKDVSYINSTWLLLLMLLISGVYAVEKLLHLKVELLPFAYVLGQGVILYLLRRISLYHITAISVDSMVKSQSYGFLMYDSAGRYLGSDEAAKRWFPELRDQPVDRRFKHRDTELFRLLYRWLMGQEKQDTVYLNSGELIIEARHTYVKERKDHRIHCVYLRDETRQQEYTRLVEQYNQDLERDVNIKTEKIRSIRDDIIISMASIVENRDSNTGGHIARTSDVIKIYVNHLRNSGDFPELSSGMARRIVDAAPLHDFGKIAILDRILNKPGKFTEEEYAEMKKHPDKGAVIVERILQNSEDVGFRQIAVNVAHYHHERWDGKGYPEGLSGEQIPFEARVMALADVFDALVSKRVYKERFDYDRAFEIIAQSRGTQFDPALCDRFLECDGELRKLYDSYTD